MPPRPWPAPLSPVCPGPSWPRLLASGLVLLGVVGCATPSSLGPRDALEAYARALQQGRDRDAYELLSGDARRNLPFEAFSRMVRENPAEVKELGNSLLRPTSPAVVTATVTAPNGETLLLVLEDGNWRVDASAIDLYGQSTPKAAVVAFLRAFEAKRYDVLLRFVPEAQAEGLTPAKLKENWEGEEKKDMKDLTEALKAALPTARFERHGDRAVMPYGAGGTVELLLERGAWKIEDFK